VAFTELLTSLILHGKMDDIGARSALETLASVAHLMDTCLSLPWPPRSAYGKNQKKPASSSEARLSQASSGEVTNLARMVGGVRLADSSVV
jgi:hypothetical protein